MNSKEKVANFFSLAIEKKTLSQAHLFCGLPGLGKFDLAMEISGKITGGEISSKFNQDRLVIEPESSEKNGVVKKKSIGVEQVKKIASFLGRTSTGGIARAVVLRDGHLMGKSAQSALLKILEDTPEKSFIIITCGDIKKIIPTVISRCQVRKFYPLGEEEFSFLIPSNHPRKKELSFWSFGRPVFLKKFLDNPHLLDEKKEDLFDFLKIFRSGIGEKFSWAEKNSKDVSLILEKIEEWKFFMRAVLLGKIKPVFSQKKAFLVLRELDLVEEKIRDTNANTRLILENFSLKV